MNCEETRPLVEEYFDGELDARAAARVTAHVAACASCAAFHESLAREQEFYLRAAPAFDATGADLWAGVSARLGEGPGGGRGAGRVASWWRGLRLGGETVAALKRPRFSPALTAAAVLAAVALTAGVMKYLDTPQTQPATTAAVTRQPAEPDSSPVVAQRDVTRAAAPSAATPDASAPDAPTPARGVDTNRAPAGRSEDVAGAGHLEGGATSKPVAASGAERVRAAVATAGAEASRRARVRPDDSPRPTTSDELVREAEGKYVAAIALLARDVRRRRPALDADEAARFERTLAAVDRAISETRRAARKRPADPVAAQYMLAAYSKKVDLLREMASH